MTGEVDQWRAVSGDNAVIAESFATLAREAVESEIPLELGVPYVTIETLDDNGQVLATGTPQA